MELKGMWFVTKIETLKNMYAFHLKWLLLACLSRRLSALKPRLIVLRKYDF